MTATVVAIFAVVYLGMVLGGLPFLQLDRTGVALLGAIASVATGALAPEQALRSLHLPTLLLLFAFMVMSAQLRLGGFYGAVVRRVAALRAPPALLLAAVIGTVALLAAVFSNDVVCLAVAPVLAEACRRRGLEPLPFLLALACAANIGSAATLVGNPQNMLIGEALRLDFLGYAREAAVPVLLSLGALWAILCLRQRNRWAARTDRAPPERREEDPRLDRWQTAKGLAVVGAVLAAFVATDWPRETVALTGAAVLLTSRRLHSTKMLGLVDWELLVLFIGLFVVNEAMARTGLPAEAVAALADAGWNLAERGPLFAATFLLSNLVSNVPAVMLLLPAATEPFSGPVLALVSTLAGNLLIVGSIANMIVATAALRLGVPFDWRAHAAVGMPVTAASLGIAAAWFALRA